MQCLCYAAEQKKKKETRRREHFHSVSDTYMCVIAHRHLQDVYEFIAMPYAVYMFHFPVYFP